jgi:hypothetical protein
MRFTRCNCCLLPISRPDSQFVDGTCTGCLNYAARSEIDWDSRKEDLLRILENAKPNVDGFAVGVPSSGGKDSVAQVLSLISMGIRPLVITATTCMLTPIGRANIDNLARYATTIELTPNRKVRAKLNRLGLELAYDISHCEHLNIFSTPFRVAAHFGLPLLAYGENPQREYSGPVGSEQQMQMNRAWISEFGGLLGLRAADFIGMEGITREDMADYQLPSEEKMSKIQAIFLGQYMPWNSHRNAQVAVKAGMRVPDEPPSVCNHWVFENLDCFLTGLHDLGAWYKHGLSRMCAQISIDIRYGLISRDEAITVLRQKEGKFPEYYLGMHYTEILRHIEMSEDRFWELARDYANKALFDVSGREPRLKADVWEQSFA